MHAFKVIVGGALFLLCVGVLHVAVARADPDPSPPVAQPQSGSGDGTIDDTVGPGPF